MNGRRRLGCPAARSISSALSPYKASVPASPVLMR
jgi:hypothetical protein